MQGR
ncbi:hypothetical protein E2C01_027523 [Portunus trituberculatus]